MSTTKTIIALVVITLGIIWFARPSATPSSQTADTASQMGGGVGAGMLRAEEPNFNFGTVSMAAGTVRNGFSITNTGTGSVKITKAYTSCMCTKATFFFGNDRLGPFGMPGHGFVPPVNRTVAPGETFTVEAAFDPAAHGPAGVGRVARTITLETDGGAPVTLNFQAVVTP